MSVDSPNPSVGWFERLFILGFLAANLVLPFTLGECYPITIAPMFRDCPELYCEFEITDSEGKGIAAETLGLHRIYDGNPVGLGVGIRPDRPIVPFGERPEPEELRRRIEARLLGQSSLQVVNVKCLVYGAVDKQHVGLVEELSYELEIKRPRSEP